MHGILIFSGHGLEKKPIDLAFPVLHGKNGEDGTVQGVLQPAGIPIAGCSLLCSALCMDKDMAHRIVKATGVRVPGSAVFHAARPEENTGLPGKESLRREKIEEEAEKLGYPLFVKPVRSGSSLGITKVTCRKELMPAVLHALEHDNSVILEEYIQGFETGCAVLGKKELMTGDLDEIELSEGFFDYTEKYTLKTSRIYVPARMEREKTEEVKKTAVKIYRALKCSGFARVDMFLTPQGEI